LGQASGGVEEILPAAEIINRMVNGAFDVFRQQAAMIPEGEPAAARL